MPRWVKAFGFIAIVLVLLVVGLKVFGLAPGGHSPGARIHGSTDAASDADLSMGCAAEPFNHGGGSGAELTCQGVHGSGKNAAQFTCRNPGHGGLQLEWEIDAKEVKVTVHDADGAAVFSETYSGNGQGTGSISEGRPGTWNIEAERADGFEGSFNVQIFCAST